MMCGRHWRFFVRKDQLFRADRPANFLRLWFSAHAKPEQRGLRRYRDYLHALVDTAGVCSNLPTITKRQKLMGIFVIDDQPLMRDAIARLIYRIQPKANIVQIDRLAAIGAAAREHGAPTLISLDLKLPDNVGIAAVVQLKQQFPQAHLVVLSAAPARDFEEACIEAGAEVYIQKSAGATEISSVLQLFLQQDLDPATSDAPSAAPAEKLSKRQKQLLVMLDKGMSNRDIALALDISEHTVKVHLWRLFKRLNVKSRSQASHLARTHGLV